jgi:hypothetical protein
LGPPHPDPLNTFSCGTLPPSCHSELKRRNPPVSANAVGAKKARKEPRAKNSFFTVSIFACCYRPRCDTERAFSGKLSPIFQLRTGYRNPAIVYRAWKSDLGSVFTKESARLSQANPNRLNQQYETSPVSSLFKGCQLKSTIGPLETCLHTFSRWPNDRLPSGATKTASSVKRAATTAGSF